VTRCDDERVARVRALRHGGENDAGGDDRRNVFQGMDREVDLVSLERLVERADEDARGVTAGRGLALARELVAVRADDDRFDGPAREERQLGRKSARLGARQRARTRAHPKRARRDGGGHF
jgi:hypothetical protein